MDDLLNILVLGGGGREHAIVRSLCGSEIARGVFCAPGNAGMAEAVRRHVDICDADAVAALCREIDAGLVFVGPEAPLVAGIADALRAQGIPVFGPGRDGALLEGSKAHSKTFMKRHGIPTAAFDICTTMQACRSALERRSAPYVIKADGLAAGKGVFLPDSREEALAICRDLLEKKTLGEAGATLVIEDFTKGVELTVFALTDGTSYRILPPSRDHKRAYDGDKGPNTGGMGAYAPVRIPGDFLDAVVAQVLEPTLRGLREDGVAYRGVLYMGLMITGTSDEDFGISVVEYNVRFGDPETQVVLPLFREDLGRVALACANGNLAPQPACGNLGHALCVVLASGGYPGAFRRGLPISGLGPEDDIPNTFVCHAGTQADADGTARTDGGRVLTVVGIGDTFGEAKERAYARTAAISFEGMHYRHDIGWSEEQ